MIIKSRSLKTQNQRIIKIIIIFNLYQSKKYIIAEFLQVKVGNSNKVAKKKIISKDIYRFYKIFIKI